MDYRTLYEAFFQHQTKPEGMTQFGDFYYEGKEYETTKSSQFRTGYMTERIREALGMANKYSPPAVADQHVAVRSPSVVSQRAIAGIERPAAHGGELRVSRRRMGQATNRCVRQAIVRGRSVRYAGGAHRRGGGG